MKIKIYCCERKSVVNGNRPKVTLPIKFLKSFKICIIIMLIKIYNKNFIEEQQQFSDILLSSWSRVFRGLQECLY